MSISTAMRCEPIVTKKFHSASFEANCAAEIYAGHVAEHVDDVIASFGRWFEVFKPGGRITITVPDCRGANRTWLERKRFPALEPSSALGWQLALEGYKPMRG